MSDNASLPFSSADHEFMARALRLAERGLHSTMPNPRVGCVLTRDGAVLGEGWHERAGGPHAEVLALGGAGGAARGATAYVTLEPCSHHGRTPPCADALIAAGVSRVVAAMRDPNPLVAGRGLRRLADAGIVVQSGLLEASAVELNVGFVSRMTRGQPWVRLKLAASLDGKTALENGVSQWITGPQARQDGHRWRARACAVLTGIGTVLSDDPQLNVRGVERLRQPLKVVVDSRLRLPLEARLLAAGETLVACGENGLAGVEELRARGAQVLSFPAADGSVALPDLLRELARREINEIHVEAGGRLNGSLLALGLVDEVLFYLAPCFLGDSARGLFSMSPLQSLADKWRLDIRDVRVVGTDIRVLARPLSPAP